MLFSTGGNNTYAEKLFYFYYIKICKWETLLIINYNLMFDLFHLAKSLFL